MSNASHAREMGWGTGTILHADPIIMLGYIVESERQWKITAIGETVVVIRTRFRFPAGADWGEWGGEHFGDFSSRNFSDVSHEYPDD